MSSLLNKIEQLIKREKISPETQKRDETKKTSNEILSELFGVFNAVPPDLDNISSKKSKKSKKKHKKEKKKRSRHSSDSDDSDYSYKHKKRKKKSKRSRREDSSPESRTPPKIQLKDIEAIIKREENKLKAEKSVKLEPVVKREHTPSLSPIKHEDDESLLYNTIDARFIPMPDDKADTEKLSKGKIQIKNLKFSTVFEQTVKQAEEEARRKAEKFEEGEYTDSSTSTPKEDYPNTEFPKTSDPSGILKKQAEEENKLNEEKTKTKAREVKSRDRSHSNRRERSRSRSHSSKRRTHYDSKSRHRSSPSSSRRSSYSSRRRSRSRRRSASRSRSGRSRISPRNRRSRSPTRVKLADSEKKRLLEVARRNAINMLKNGAVPAGAAALPPHTRNQVMAAIQSGGKSVDELTDFCKHLSKKEALGELSSVSDDGEMSENEDTLAFHHPFLVKEKAPIVMNIRGSAPLPTKGTTAPVNKDELRLQFPVSSGTDHRSQWLPVEPPPKEKEIPAPKPVPVPKPPKASFLGICDKPKPPAPVAPPPPAQTSALSRMNATSYSNDFTPALPAPPLPPPGPQAYPSNMKLPHEDLISSVVLEKLANIRREQERTESARVSHDVYPKSNLGQFMGSTGAHILTPKELASGTQAWAKKDQLTRAPPVIGGMGLHLLQKMGWTPGQGLGKEGTGTLQPLLLEVKLDTRGLQTKDEMKNRGRRNHASTSSISANGKHPVSLLGEYCSKHKLGPPEYNLCFECGPDHKKNFLFRVKVAGTEYQPAVASANKKQAKADAALLALQKLGILFAK